MSHMENWRAGKWPWDMAAGCTCCLVMHTNHTQGLQCHNHDHAEMRQVVKEQGLVEFYDACAWDHTMERDNSTPRAEKWLADNYEKCVAIRELYRDKYAYNSAPPEQTELPLEPEEVGTKV